MKGDTRVLFATNELSFERRPASVNERPPLAQSVASAAGRTLAASSKIACGARRKRSHSV
jgi:hypothetical protein